MLGAVRVPNFMPQVAGGSAATQAFRRSLQGYLTDKKTHPHRTLP